MRPLVPRGPTAGASSVVARAAKSSPALRTVRLPPFPRLLSHCTSTAIYQGICIVRSPRTRFRRKIYPTTFPGQISVLEMKFCCIYLLSSCPRFSVLFPAPRAAVSSSLNWFSESRVAAFGSLVKALWLERRRLPVRFVAHVTCSAALLALCWSCPPHTSPFVFFVDYTCSFQFNAKNCSSVTLVRHIQNSI